MAVLLTAVFLCLCLPVQSHPKPLETKAVFGQYLVRVDQDRHGFRILRQGKQVYSYKAEGPGFIIDFGQRAYPKNKIPEIATGTDITGEGVPNLIVREHDGATHCCPVFHVFALGKEFRKVATVNLGDGYFADVDGDGRYEYLAGDEALHYFPCAHNTGYLPTVIFRYVDGDYRPAPDLMRKSPPDGARIQALARKVRAMVWEDCPPKDLYAFMLEMVYSGNERLAYEFLNSAWRPEEKGKDQFLARFREALRRSTYWPLLQALNVP